MAEEGLILLRNAITNNKTIVLLKDNEPCYELPISTHISIPKSSSNSQVIFPKSTLTRFLRPSSDDDTYDLETLLYAFMNKELSAGEYMKKASNEGVKVVPIIDRRIVLEWLEGKSAIQGPEGRFKRDHVERPITSSSALPASSTSSSHPELKRSLPSDPSASSSNAASSTSLPTSSSSPAKKSRFVPDKADHDYVEKLLAIIDGPPPAVGPQGEHDRMGGVWKNRETVLRGDRVNNFDSVRALVAPRLKQARDELNQQANNSSAAPAVPSATKPNPKKKSQHPIIIISPSSTALVTMRNVKKFLEEAIFEPYDPKSGSESYSQAQDFVIVDHVRTVTSISAPAGATGPSSNATKIMGEKKVRFYVVDGVEALSKFGGLEEAWDRVVCVMTTGQEWQFRPYKWTEPKELFHHVKGIFLQWTNEPPNQKVRGWNVTELRIDPNKRHIDKSTVADFWRALESWMAMHRPNLLS